MATAAVRQSTTVHTEPQSSAELPVRKILISLNSGWEENAPTRGHCFAGEFAHLIKHLTGDGDTVLDCFVGGGSVAAAAIKLGRQFVGIDLRRENVETTRRRIEDVLRGIH